MENTVNKTDPSTPPRGWREHILSALGNGPFRWLADHPVLWRGRHVTVITFGLLAAIEALVFQMVILMYFEYRGLPFGRAELFEMFTIAIAVCLGAKLFHWLAVWRNLMKNPKKHLAETGFYLQGGILGGFLWALISSGGNEGATALMWMDAMSCGGLLGQVVGRLACLSYGCCFGKPSACGHGIVYRHESSKVVRWRPDLRGVPLHPAQIYDGLLSLLGFVALLCVIHAQPAPGTIAAITLCWHGATRLIIERYRADIHFQEGRNWTTYITAWLLLGAGLVLLGIIQQWPPAADGIRLVDNVGLPPLEIGAVFAANALLIFAVYGIHGPQLGRFPFLGR